MPTLRTLAPSPRQRAMNEARADLARFDIETTTAGFQAQLAGLSRPKLRRVFRALRRILRDELSQFNRTTHTTAHTANREIARRTAIIADFTGGVITPVTHVLAAHKTLLVVREANDDEIADEIADEIDGMEPDWAGMAESRALAGAYATLARC